MLPKRALIILDEAAAVFLQHKILETAPLCFSLRLPDPSFFFLSGMGKLFLGGAKICSFFLLREREILDCFLIEPPAPKTFFHAQGGEEATAFLLLLHFVKSGNSVSYD